MRIESRIVVPQTGIGNVLEPVSELNPAGQLQRDPDMAGELERTPKVALPQVIPAQKGGRRPTDQGQWQALIGEPKGRPEGTNHGVIVVITHPAERT